jgi:hypothetical protein
VRIVKAVGFVCGLDTALCRGRVGRGKGVDLVCGLGISVCLVVVWKEGKCLV